MSRRLWAALMATAALCASSSALATSKVWRILPTLNARARSNEGPCGEFKSIGMYFSGSIEVIGHLDPNTPAVIAYQYLRSDGTSTPVVTYSIDQQRSPDGHTAKESLAEEWDVRVSQLGWDRVKVWPVNQPDFPPVYTKKTFVRFTCTG